MKYDYLKIKRVAELEYKEIPEDRMLDNIGMQCLGGLEKRGGGDFDKKAFWLPKGYDWEMGEDNEGCLILVPLKKEK